MARQAQLSIFPAAFLLRVILFLFRSLRRRRIPEPQ